MSIFCTSLMRLIVAGIMLFTLTGVALAACTDVRTIDLDKQTDITVEDIQLGLRTAYDDRGNPLLNDGRFGALTRNQLVELCVDVPRPPGQADVPATLDLIREYAEAGRLWPDWAGDLYSLTLIDGDGEPAEEALGLRLAATPPMKTHAMGRRGTLYDCAAPTQALEDVPDGLKAFLKLTRLYRDKTDTEICQMLPVIGGIEDWQQAMERLGQIDSGQRTGAIQTLQSGAFMRWIDEGEGTSATPQSSANWIDESSVRTDRLRRLVGTLPAVLALLDEYNSLGTGTPGQTNYTEGPCTPPLEERTTIYYSLDQSDVDNLDFLISLTPALDAFREAQAGFDNPQALWRALEPVLAEHLEDCILTEIEALVKGPDRLPLAFLLKPRATEALMARKELETAVPVLTELAPVRTATKAELVNRIRAGLEDVQDAAVGEEVTKAADTLAAASEPVNPATDTPILDLELDEDAEPTPLMTVTDAADAAVQTAVDNPELTDALRNTPMEDATVPELIRSQVRAALDDTATRQAQQTVDSQIALIEPSISSTWALTDALEAEILALPYVNASITDATAESAIDRLKPLIGVSYPSRRLFEDALDTVANDPGFVPFSPFVRERILEAAQKNVPNENAPRAFGPLQIEDCNCIPRRLEDNLSVYTVYGFYPFWLAPPLHSTTSSQTKADASEDGADKPAEDVTPQLQQVDFSAVDQIAFYGLEFRPDASGRVSLHHRDHWRAAKRSFVNSAHLYRARADVTFDLREWQTWDRATIDEVVDEIALEMAPFDKIQGFDIPNLINAVPTLFDRAQPDGVTLIFHDYEGATLNAAEMDKMTRIIKSVYEALPNRDDLHVNVGFDFALVQEEPDGSGNFAPILEGGIFDELFDLIQDKPYVFADEDPEADGFDAFADSRERKRVINKILLFLERPTTDAKKGLRFRMEQGRFQGETRRQVLRSIIPVVPPAGHEQVLTSIKPNDPDTSERLPFSQLEDDIVYFKDNFSGIGFWTVLDPSGPETPTINQLIAQHFNDTASWLAPESYPQQVRDICTFACPNRAAIMLACIALFAAIMGMIVWSFYNGVVDRIAFRFLVVGVVPIGFLVLVVTLGALAFCDPKSWAPEVFGALLFVMIAVASIIKFIARLRDGPKP